MVIHSGVYREYVDVSVSGTPEHPITFAAAPGASVVIKGSELVRNKWEQLGAVKNLTEPFPGAFRRVWRTALGEEFFKDPKYGVAYANRTNRWISQVFISDSRPLQMIGPDALYKNDKFERLRTIGHGLADMVPESFYFDPKDQMLYLDIVGDPVWNTVEVGVRAFALTVTGVHDVVVRGLEMRHNRQTGSQWSLVGVTGCQRVTLEDCRVSGADYNGLSVGGSTHCLVRHCSLSYNGCTGLALGSTEDCTVEDCTLMFNNYRHFLPDWGVAAGMKNIPLNKRATIRRCEAAYNFEASGIWFDSESADARILDNICHDNDDSGIVVEINPAGAVIAGNLVYRNRGRGIFVSGSQYTWVVHNTVARNGLGIVAMTRAAGEPAKSTQVLDNLLIENYTAAETVSHGADLILEMSRGASERKAMGSGSDYNVFANTVGVPAVNFSWNDSLTLGQWQEQFGQDKHSVALPIRYEQIATGFRLLNTRGLNICPLVPPAISRVWTPAKSSRAGCDLTAWPNR